MLYLERYREVTRQAGRKEPDEDDLDELAGMWLTRFLHEANETTKYAYESELIRKRDRAKEALKAVPTKVQKQLEMENAVRYVIHQDAYYTDMASQDAELQALKDAGVKKVIRMESDDEKTCMTCRKLKGKIYEIGKVPPLEHIHCRRWFLPYSGKAERI